MFKIFADKVNAKFLELSSTNQLFRVNVSKEELWNTYQNSYTPESNPIFRERRVHECNTCNSFINRLGPVVSIIDNQLDTIWNVEGLPEPYATVAAAMHELVLSYDISSIFLADEATVGKEFNIEANEAGDIKWEHFYADIDQAFITQDVASERGAADSTISVFKRALDEFSLSALTTVEDLCDSIYKGEEFKPTVSKFIEAKKAYEASDKKLFVWCNYKKYPAKIRNSAIGALIININEGMELEAAVKSYETMVAPANYKRTTAVVTEGMKKQAMKTIDELGIEPSLARRHATLEDISVNNVLFANRDSAALMKGTLASLLNSTTISKVPTSAIDISIDKFLSDVLPNSGTVEALVENKHIGNFVSLVAPINPDAPSILKWNNNFSWSYKGEVTDAMKERVKSAGGSVDGVLRCTLQWNEDQADRENDLDLHCIEVNKNHIYFGNKGRRHLSSAMLDVDIQRPCSDIAVENIIYNDLNKMPDGDYKFYVNNYSGRNAKGFRAQIEFNGIIHEFNYPTEVTRDVPIATITLNDGVFSMASELKSSQSQQVEWSTSTLQYQKVSTIMLSPNYWDGQQIGNKHYFFMLEGCKNPSAVRGFYNEFLSNDLTPHRKTFEMISSMMKCESADNQLSGLGFSSTIRNNVHLKVDGKPYNVLF